MKDIEGLAKTLSQVVNSLQSLIASKKTENKIIEQKSEKLKKAPELTYSQFIEKVCSTKDLTQIKSKNQSFSLHEDLKLLQQLSKYDQISQVSFDQISKKSFPKRSSQSLRSRYENCLSKIEQVFMQKVVTWIENQGLQGYLVLDQGNTIIQRQDPKDLKNRKKSSRKDRHARKIQNQQNKKQFSENCKELHQVLKLYSKTVGIPPQKLLKLLDKVSGDFIALDNYIETKDQRLLWTQEQDQILIKGGSQLEVLKRFRGSAVDLRKQYLKIL